MSQFTHGTIDPNTKDGTQLALDIASGESAQNTNHSGASRPVYAVAGMTWIKTVSSTQHEWYYYDGTDDLLIGTFDPTNNVWKLSAIGKGGVASNTVIGTDALGSNTTGSNNIAFGTDALKNNTTASYKIAIGYQSQYTSATGGAYNIGIGYKTLYSNTTGNSNIANGYQALYSNTTGYYNIANGYQALYSNMEGYNNIANGYQALYSNTTGNNNIANGYQALYSNTTGNNNIANGYQALYSNIGGGWNIALGVSALFYNATGLYNIAVGTTSLYSNTGSSNTAIGYGSGRGATPFTYANTTGANNIFIGYQAVGASATASNVITLGNSSITTLRCQVTSITSLSDERDKTDILTLQESLPFINSLNPISFTWNMRDGGKVDVPDTGFIAQELQESQKNNEYNIPGLVYEENPERLEAAYAKLIPTMVKAIQELSDKIEIQRQEINSLKGLN